MQNETIAQKALRLVKDIPADNFISGEFTNEEDKCCVLGHYIRLTSSNPEDFSKENCKDVSNFNSKDGDTGCDLRNVSNNFIYETHGEKKSIAWVNNYDNINGYNEPVIKDRVIHCLEDMVKAGY